MNRWQRLDQSIARVEQGAVAICLSLMILVAFTQIVLRNFFDTGLNWGEPLVRFGVLWVGFIGAALATKEGKHVRIDLLARWTSGVHHRALAVFTNGVSAVVCGLLTKAAVTFIRNEAELGGSAFLNLPLWSVQIVMPICFGLMTLRYTMRAIDAIGGRAADVTDADG
jgi:TRAP-type C4-dicarboxylate transport system permease small subunit